MNRRQSSDVMADARHGSPHLAVHSDKVGQSKERKKSLFPAVAGAQRLGHKPSIINAGYLGKKSMIPPKSEERERSAYPPPQNLEPTYRMDPQRKFYAPQVHELIKQILDAHLTDFTFNIKFTPTMTKVLSDEVKERCKGLGFDRYKFVVSVIMGERRDQGIMISSRAAWDSKLDSYATYTFVNKSLFCTCSVYGVYAE